MIFDLFSLDMPTLMELTGIKYWRELYHIRLVSPSLRSGCSGLTGITRMWKKRIGLLAKTAWFCKILLTDLWELNYFILSYKFQVLLRSIIVLFYCYSCHNHWVYQYGIDTCVMTSRKNQIAACTCRVTCFSSMCTILCLFQVTPPALSTMVGAAISV